MDNFMTSKITLVQDFPWGPVPQAIKDKVFVFKMSVDLASHEVESVKHMQVGGDMEEFVNIV